jgi:hypothetical protein
LAPYTHGRLAHSSMSMPQVPSFMIRQSASYSPMFANSQKPPAKPGTQEHVQSPLATRVSVLDSMQSAPLSHSFAAHSSMSMSQLPAATLQVSASRQVYAQSHTPFA